MPQPCVSVDTPAVFARRDNLLNLAAELGRTDLVQKMLDTHSWDGKDFRSALIKACEYSHFAPQPAYAIRELFERDFGFISLTSLP